MAAISYYVYTVLLFVGAFMGYNAGSKVSLIMGLISGAVMITGLVMYRKCIKGGSGIIGGLSLVLLIVFVIRFLKTGVFMPAGLMSISSAIVLAMAIRQFVSDKKEGCKDQCKCQ